MRAVFVTIAWMALLGASHALYAQSYQPFSAVMNNPFITMFGGPPTPMYVYVDGAVQRVNSPAPGKLASEQKTETDWLILFDKHLRYAIAPNQHTCQVSTFPDSAAPDLDLVNVLWGQMSVPKASPTTKIIPLGTGMAAGVLCNIEEIRTSGGVADPGLPPVMKVWIAKDFGRPVKIEIPGSVLQQTQETRESQIKVSAKYDNGENVQFKPQEKVAFIFMESIENLERQCRNTALHRECSLDELIKSIHTSTTDGNKVTIGLDHDPGKDSNYQYSIRSSGDRWTGEARPRRTGLGGFYFEQTNFGLAQLYFNPSGAASATSRVFKERGLEGGDYTLAAFGPSGEGGDLSILELTSLKVGRSNPALFVPPAHCQTTKWDGNTWKNFSGSAEMTVNASGTVTMNSPGSQSHVQITGGVTQAFGSADETTLKRIAEETGGGPEDYASASVLPKDSFSHACTIFFRVVHAGTMAPISGGFSIGLSRDPDASGTPPDVTSQFRNGVLRIENPPRQFSLSYSFAEGGGGGADIATQCFSPQTVLLLVIKNTQNVTEGADLVFAKSGKYAKVTASELASDAPANLIVNGNFEGGNTGFTSGYTYGNVNGPTSYTIATNPSQADGAYPDWYNGGDHTSGSGKMLLVNGANSASTPIWKETVSVKPRTTYAFSFWGAEVDHSSNSIPHLQLRINGDAVGTGDIPVKSPDNGGRWQNFSFRWSSGSSIRAVLAIYDLNTDTGWNDFALDDISFVPQ